MVGVDGICGIGTAHRTCGSGAHGIAAEKRRVRAEMGAEMRRFAAEASATFAALGEAAARAVTAHPSFARADAVLAYYPAPSEIPPLAILEQARALGKLAALPRVRAGAPTAHADSSHKKTGAFPALGGRALGANPARTAGVPTADDITQETADAPPALGGCSARAGSAPADSAEPAMDFFALAPGVPIARQVEPGAFGLHEPRADCALLAPESLRGARVLVVVPGVAFTARGARLGHGKGYYDRYIPRLVAAGALVTCTGFCFNRQVLPVLPVDSFDTTMDFVATERHFFESTE